MGNKIYLKSRVKENIEKGNPIIIVENQLMCDLSNVSCIRCDLKQFVTTIMGGIDRKDLTIEDLEVFKGANVVLFGIESEFASLKALLKNVANRVLNIDPTNPKDFEIIEKEMPNGKKQIITRHYFE